jgi:hypothetical protein
MEKLLILITKYLITKIFMVSIGYYAWCKLEFNMKYNDLYTVTLHNCFELFIELNSFYP